MKKHLSLVRDLSQHELNIDDLQIVVLEAPNETILTEEGKRLFANILALRIKGYTAVHSKAILPLDTTDFIANHMLVCTRENPLENILTSYKSTSVSMCTKYNIAFPFLSILERCAHPNCLNEMKRVLAFCEDHQQDLSYEAGWTMDPVIENHKELRNILKEMVTTFVINYHRDYNVPHWATFGICKVKTDQLFLKMGLKELSDQPLISHPYLLETLARAVIVMDNKYSEYTFETCKKYQSLWDNRITISVDQAQKILEKKKTA